jgi:hypothetical protein
MILQLWWKSGLSSSYTWCPRLKCREFLVETVFELLALIETSVLLNLSIGVLRNVASILKVSSGNESLSLTWAASDTDLGLVL